MRKVRHTALDEARAEVARLARALAVSRVELELRVLGLPPVCSSIAARRSLDGIECTREIAPAEIEAALARAIALDDVREMAAVLDLTLPVTAIGVLPETAAAPAPDDAV